jgi:hypothetical protein
MSKTAQTKIKLKLFNWGYLLVNASERPIAHSDYMELKSVGEIQLKKAGVCLTRYAVAELQKRGYKIEVVAVGN